MGFEAQDPVSMILLRIVGAVFAGAGLWLLLKPKPSGSTAKIELFGLKFESSSAGVLVFLIGAAFLATPLFVPQKDPVRLPTERNKPGEPHTPQPVPSGQEALILPPDPEVAESEPNDRVQAANQIGLGQTVSGTVRKGNNDWFVVAVPEGPAFIELRVRKVDGSVLHVRLLDAREQKIKDAEVYYLEAKYIRGEVIGNDRFYVLVWGAGETTTYEFTVLPVSD